MGVILAGLWCALAGVVHAAGDPAAGKLKFSTCMGCHGIPGYSNVYPTYHVPRLGGQHAEYIVAALKGYAANDRDHATMHANASALSEQDMVDIAAFLSSLTLDRASRVVPPGDPDAGQKKSATCVACHAENGISPSGQFPILAGQHADYLVKSLQDYKSGARKNAIMSGMAAALSAQDQADLASYYANQETGLVTVE